MFTINAVTVPSLGKWSWEMNSHPGWMFKLSSGTQVANFSRPGSWTWTFRRLSWTKMVCHTKKPTSQVWCFPVALFMYPNHSEPRYLSLYICAFWGSSKAPTLEVMVWIKRLIWFLIPGSFPCIRNASATKPHENTSIKQPGAPDQALINTT